MNPGGEEMFVPDTYMEIKFRENKLFSVKQIVSHIFQQVNSVEKKHKFYSVGNSVSLSNTVL